MTTEDLIRRLAADPRPAPTVARTLARWLGPAVLAAFASMAFGWGFRPDLLRAYADPVVALKVVLPSLLAGAAVVGALRLARPEGHTRGSVAALALVALTALGLWTFGFAVTPRENWGAAMQGSTLAACLLSIPTLAFLPTLALLLALRRGASLSSTLSGALAGLGGGGIAASVYAFHCPEDQPLFFVTWYGTGILIVTVLGALAGRRWLRW